MYVYAFIYELFNDVNNSDYTTSKDIKLMYNEMKTIRKQSVVAQSVVPSHHLSQAPHSFPAAVLPYCYVRQMLSSDICVPHSGLTGPDGHIDL
jgi:hypothetical protein